MRPFKMGQRRDPRIICFLRKMLSLHTGNIRAPFTSSWCRSTTGECAETISGAVTLEGLWVHLTTIISLAWSMKGANTAECISMQMHVYTYSAWVGVTYNRKFVFLFAYFNAGTMVDNNEQVMCIYYLHILLKRLEFCVDWIFNIIYRLIIWTPSRFILISIAFLQIKKFSNHCIIYWVITLT